MKRAFIRTCQIAFIAAVALLYAVRAGDSNEDLSICDKKYVI